MNNLNVEPAVSGLKSVFVGTSFPRECGLAVFSQDMMNELATFEDFTPPTIIAIEDGRSYAYGNEVIGKIAQNNLDDYLNSAAELNRTDTDVVIIQHEFGIYGGENGSYILDFAAALRVPFIVIFHTVLASPSAEQQRIMTELAALSFKVVTMARNKMPDLINIYGITPDKIEMHHHGVPTVRTESREALKMRYGFPRRQILSTFGFLSPGKGIEYVIEAMSSVVKTHPEALYIVWGRTHPGIKRREGEVYRESLQERVAELQLGENVIFVDKHLSQEEVVQSLVMSDIYLTPYLGQDQAVSGTLAFGIGYGRVVISTPYRYAQEMLAGGRGLLAEFRDSASLERHILSVFNQPELKADMERKTLMLGRTMHWNEIAGEYADLLRTCAAKGSVI
ncbi:glycosyltransferase family 4 protein [Saccharibacillus kuerlensis]|uniref:Glycosyl transferase family 1 n=1 Tax=Saccharibacillus kuerlensis TaxID=459527 RepID=A0ABQ2L4T2_9BACL|nr:glycosyltransferase family 4 protein [Saccharibacillus kuerlensis]GGO02882.1 glycosyl transferase family 1 [Saccharibacillus kuerlensis]